MNLLLTLLAAALVACAVYAITAPRQGFQFGNAPPPDKRQRAKNQAVKNEENLKGIKRLVWMSGIPIPYLTVRPIQLVAGGLVGLATLTLTHNVVVAVIFGVFGFQGPVAFLRNLALARWRAADNETYVMANTMRFTLPVQGHPVTALRQVAPSLQEPLRTWLGMVLAQEALGGSAEAGLHELGLRLGHSELQLLAEILKADRREKPASELLAELIDAWTERIRGDQKKQAKIASTRRFANAIIGGPMVAFLLLPVMSPATAAVFQNSLAGQASADAAMLLFAAAAYVVKNSVKRSQEISV